MDIPLTEKYIQIKEASKTSGYSVDYLTRLCRAKKNEATVVGRTWFVNKYSLSAFVIEQQEKKKAIAEELRTLRTLEYRDRVSPSVAVAARPAVRPFGPKLTSVHKTVRPAFALSLTLLVMGASVFASTNESFLRSLGSVASALEDYQQTSPEVIPAKIPLAFANLGGLIGEGVSSAVVEAPASYHSVLLTLVSTPKQQSASLALAPVERGLGEQIALAVYTAISDFFARTTNHFAEVFNIRPRVIVVVPNDTPNFYPSTGLPPATTTSIRNVYNPVSNQTIQQTIVQGVSSRYVDQYVSSYVDTVFKILSQRIDTLPRGSGHNSGSGPSGSTVTSISSGNISGATITNSTFSGGVSASTLSVSGDATFSGTTTFSGPIVFSGLTGLVQCLHVDASGVVSGTGVDCGAGGGGSGITSLNGLVNTIQTFATSSDPNISLSIVSSGSTHTFTPAWKGILSVIRGGTGLSSVTPNGLLIGDSSGTGYLQIATSSLGLSTTNINEGTNLFYTLSRFATALAGTTTDALAEGTLNRYYTDARARNAYSATATGLSYATTTGVLSLAPGYEIPLSASTSNWQTFYTTPSFRITAGTNISWAGNTLNGPSDAYMRGLFSATSPLSYNNGTGVFSIAQSGIASDGYLSASDWNLFNGKFATTSTNYWLSTKNSDALAEGTVNLYYSDSRVATFLNTLSKDFFFSTSSADFWKTQRDFFSTTSATYFLTQNQGNAFSTTSANNWFTTKTTDNLTQGVTNLFYSNTLVNSFINSSTTIPKTYTANTYTGSNVFNGGLTIGSLTGPLQAINGVVSATTTLSGVYGGTGSTTLSGILAGNGVAGVKTLLIGSGLTFDGTTLATSGAGITQIGPAGQLQSGGTQTLASSTTGTDFSITASGNTITFNLPSASLTNRGLLSSTDYSFFNNKISSTSLSGGTGISYSSATGVITNTGVTSLTGTYPVQASAATGAVTLSLAFGTTTSNTWGGTQTFTNAPVLGSLTGVLVGANGTVSASSTLSVNVGGTGLSSVTAGGLLYGNGTGALGITSAGTPGFVLAYLNGIPTWTASTTLSTITGVLSQGKGGTGLTGYTPGDIIYADSGGNLTTLPIGSSGTVLKVTGGYPAWGTDLTTGGGGGAGAWATTSDSLAVYPTNTSNVIIIGSSATTTRNSILEVFGQQYVSSVLTIGSTSPIPGYKLVANGDGLFSNKVQANFFTATGTSASTFPYASTTALTVSGSAYLGSLTGPLQAVNGLVSATNTLSVVYGGTGISTTPTFGQILVGNSTSGYTLTATSSLGLESALTFNSPLTRSGNAISIQQGTGSQNGYLASSDYTLFNNKISSTSLSSANVGLTYNSSTGVFTVATSSLFTGTTGQFPYFSGTNTLVGTSSLFLASSGKVGIGTTSPNSLLSIRGGNTSATVNTAVLQLGVSPSQSSSGVELGVGNSTGANKGFIQGLTFTTGAAADFVINPFGGNTLINPGAGSVGVGSTTPFAKLSVHANNGDTATTLFAIGSSTASATSTLFSISNSGATTFGAYSNGGLAVDATGSLYTFSTSTWRFASSTLLGDSNTFSGTLNTFTNAPKLGSLSGVIYGNAGTLNTAATSTPTFGLGFTAGGTWNVLGSAPTLTIATSSLYTGTLGQVAYFNGSNSLIGTSSLFIASNGNVGIGSTSPYGQLSINPNGISGPAFVIGSSTATSFIVTNGGNVGIGSSTPSQPLVVRNANDSSAVIETAFGASNYLKRASAVCTGCGPDLSFVRTRGTLAAPADIINGDTFGDFTFRGRVGGVENFFAQFGAYYDINTNTGILNFQTGTAGNTSTRMIIDGSGNVGIGTTSPSARLTVNGSSYFAGALLATSTVQLTNYTNGGLAVDATGSLYTFSTSTWRFASSTLLGDSNTFSGTLNTFTNAPKLGSLSGVIYGNAGTLNTAATSTATLGLGLSGTLTTLGSSNLSIATSSLFTGTLGQVAYFNGSNSLIGTSSLFIASNGNVGIGLVSPNFKLDVAGPINTDQYSGYYQNGRLLAYASSTNGSTVLGYSAGGQSATTSSSFILNTAIGYQTLNAITSATKDTAVGASALQSVTSGSDNTAVGYASLSSLTTGFRNTAVGEFAGTNNQTGRNNVYLGYTAGGGSGSGDYNTFIGTNAGSNVTTGYGNTLIGGTDFIANTLTTGGNNIALGFNTFFPSNTANNQLNIGNFLFGTVPATTTATTFQLPTSGSFSVGSSSPYSKFSIQTNNGDTAKTLFAIGSSTASATTTLFSISNTGLLDTVLTAGLVVSDSSGFLSASTTLSAQYGGTGSTTLSGILAGNGVAGVKTLLVGTGLSFDGATLSATGGSSAYPFGLAGNATSTLTQFNGGLTSYASTTIGNGTQTGGLTVSGFSTTTADAYFATRIGIGTAPNSLNTVSLGGSAPNISFKAGASASTVIKSNAGDLQVLTNDGTVIAATFAQSSYVGIGNGATIPSYQLDVAGFINTDQYSGYKQAGNTILYASSTNLSTLVGIGAGTNLKATANYSSALGYQALTTATSSQYNTAVGYQTLSSVVDNANGTGVGNAFGGANTALGYQALLSNTTGSKNIGIGYQALSGNTTAYQQTAIGYQALSSGSLSGLDNVAIGFKAGQSNAAGADNTALGNFALNTNTSGSNNVGIGFGASYYNNAAVGTVAIGQLAAYGAGSPYNNTGSVAVGTQSGYNFAVGSDYNTLLGYQAGFNITSGARNIVIGSDSGVSGANSTITSGSNNIQIGNNISFADGTASNQLNIGNFIYGTGLSGTGTTVSPGKLGIGTTSPQVKLSVQDNSNEQLRLAYDNTNYTRFSVGATGNLTVAASTTVLSNPANLNLSFLQTNVGNLNLGGAGSAYPALGYNLNYSLTPYSYTYRGNDTAFGIEFGGSGGNAIKFNVAPSGTAGNSISFNTPLTLTTNNATIPYASSTALTVSGSTYLATAGENVGIGTTSPSAKLSVVGSSYFAGSLVATSTVQLTNYTNGLLGVGTTGNLYSYASSSLFGFTPSPYPFGLANNATSTLTQFNGGITAFASSTIGNGLGGLTISGNATTTGTTNLEGTLTLNAYGAGGGSVLTVSNGVVGKLDTLSVNLGGTGSSTLSGILTGNGTSQVSSLVLGTGLSFSANTLTIATSSLYTGTTGQLPYFSGTNTITATSSIFIATNGNVGIGTTNPVGGTLVVGGSQAGNAGLEIIPGSGVVFQSYNRTGSAYTAFNMDASTFAWRPSGVSAMVLTSAGLLGVGTTTPYAKISVHANNGETNTTLFAIGSSTASATTTLFSINNSGSLDLGTVSTQGFHVINNAVTAGNGLSITTTAAGSGVTLSTLSSSANEGLTVQAKANGNVSIKSGGGSISLNTFGNDVLSVLTNGTGLNVSPTAISNNNTTQFSFTGAANTNLNTGSEVADVGFFLGQTKQHALGNIALQRSFLITAPTESFVSFSTTNTNFTNLAALGISGSPLLGLNATASSSHTIYLGSSALNASTTNSYGITVNANTGAVNNYAAQFLGGNVGVGTSSPYAKLSIHANSGELNQNLFIIGSSTASATTTLFSVSNSGNLSVGNTVTFGNQNGANICSFITSGNLVQLCSEGNNDVSIGTNSGLYLVRANANASQPFGIGTSSPWGKLSINPTASQGSFPSFVIGSSTKTDFIVTNAGNVGIGTTSPLSKLAVSGGVSIGANYNVAAPTNGFLVEGTVGIGTTTPRNTLSVLGGFSVGNDYIGNATSWGMKVVNNGNAFGETFFHAQGAQLAIYTNPQGSAQAGALGYSYPAGSNGIISSGSLVFGTSNAEKMRIDASGNVGIGTTSPNAKLNIYTGPSGVAPNNTADDLVIESNTAAGLSILAGTSQTSRLFFGDSGDNLMARVDWDGSTKLFTLGSSDNTGQTRILSGNETEVIRLTSGGNVGIGTTSPAKTFSVVGGTYLAGSLYASSTVQFSNFGAGTLTTDASGNLSVSSDERLKDLNGTFTRGLADIKQLNPILYHWNTVSGLDTSTQYAGFSAQNVQGAIPEAVDTDPRGYLTLSDRPIIAASVNAIKELAGITDSLSSATTTLAFRVGVLEQKEETKPVTITTTLLTASTINAGSVMIDAVTAKQYFAPVDAMTFTFASSSLPVEVLSTDGQSVNILALATFTYAKVDDAIARLDVLTNRVTALEANVALLQQASSTPSSGFVGNITSAVVDVLKSFGITISNGLAQFKTVSAEQFVAKSLPDGSSTAGEGVLAIGTTTATVTNPLVHTSSKVFVTFTGSVEGGWYVKKEEGKFNVVFSQAQATSTPFDYFILQTDSQAAAAGASGGSTSPPPPAPAPAPAGGGPDTIAPTITLTGMSSVTLTVGDVWSDPGATATDDVDGDVTANITSSGTVDTTTAGTYTITYSVTDLAGNGTMVARTVTVQ